MENINRGAGAGARGASLPSILVAQLGGRAVALPYNWPAILAAVDDRIGAVRYVGADNTVALHFAGELPNHVHEYALVSVRPLTGHAPALAFLSEHLAAQPEIEADLDALHAA